MFRTLFAKEIAENIATHRFILVCTLCLVVIPFGVYIGARDYRVQLHAYQESVRLYYEGHKVVGDILYKGAQGFRPPSALGFLSQGLEFFLPNVVGSPARRENPPVELRLNNTQSYENLYGSLHGPLDIVFIVSVIMTFLAVVFSFGAVSGEKEQGTLRQILCNAVPRHQILLAKVTASFLALVVPFIMAIILSLLVLLVTGFNFSTTGSFMTAIAFALILSFLVIGAFLNLGVLISSLTRQAVSSFIILLFCWVFLFGVYPRLSVVLSRLIYPTKSQQLVFLERGRLRLENENALAAEMNKIVESAGNTQEKQDAITSEFRAKLTDQLQKLDLDLESRRNKQLQIAVNLSRLSPVCCYVRPMSEISRTGWMQWQEFKRDVARFGRALDEQVYGMYQVFRQKGGAAGVGFRGDSLAPAPVFRTSMTREEDIIKNILPDAVLLVVFNIIIFAVTFVVFLKYDAR